MQIFICFNVSNAQTLCIFISLSFSIILLLFMTIQPSTTVLFWIHLLDVNRWRQHGGCLNMTYCTWFLSEHCNVYGGNVLCVNLSAQFTDMLDWDASCCSEVYNLLFKATFIVAFGTLLLRVSRATLCGSVVTGAGVLKLLAAWYNFLRKSFFPGRYLGPWQVLFGCY